jgi:hypothetical protein
MAHIVGGGSSDGSRRNIYTLDWKGNAEFAGGAAFNGPVKQIINSETTI